MLVARREARYSCVFIAIGDAGDPMKTVLRLLTLSITAMLAAPMTASAQKCDARRIDALARHDACVLLAQAKSVRSAGTIDGAGEPGCGEVFASKWTNATAEGGCSTVVSGEQAFDLSTTLAGEQTELLAPDASGTPSVCASLQLKAAAKYVGCRLKVERVHLVTGKPRDFAKCDARLASVLAKTDSLDDCLTAATAGTIRTELEADADDIVALVTVPSVPTTTSTTSTTVPADPFSDDFETGSLDPAWNVLHPEMATISVSGGQLHLQIDVTGNWYQTLESVLVYKLVTGDFDIHATVHAARTSNPAMSPAAQYRLGGILARDPASTPADSNFVHVAVGAGSFAVPMAAEWKSTDDSSSAYDFAPLSATEAELRLTRAGNDFTWYYRDIGAMTWQVLHAQTRSDLPATLQVGLMAYDPNGGVDLTVSIDDITLE